MGYITDYYGTIKLSNKKIADKLNNFFEDDEDLEEHFDVNGIVINNQEIEISGYGKMYKAELEKFCLFIAKIDKESYGEIGCKGEESDDFWKIDIGGGGVDVKRGAVVYDEDGEEFKSNKINKDVYKITKDEYLLKEIIIEELDEK